MKVQSMKKLMVCLMCVASVVTTTAQGTFTASNDYVPKGATDKAFILDINGRPASADTHLVSIIYDGYPLGPYWGIPLVADGLFSLENIIVPNTKPGDDITVTIVAWDNSYGNFRYGGTVQQLVTVNIKNLGGVEILQTGEVIKTPAATLEFNSDFRGLNIASIIVPEPSTYALMALGLIGVFFINKRK